MACHEEEPGPWILRRVSVSKGSLLIEMARPDDGGKMVSTDRMHRYAGANWLTLSTA
jgi:hypothetical protein